MKRVGFIYGCVSVVFAFLCHVPSSLGVERDVVDINYLGPLEHVKFSGYPLHEVQARTIAYALRSQNADIIRMVCRKGMVHTEGLKGVNVEIDTEKLKEFLLNVPVKEFDAEAVREQLGWGSAPRYRIILGSAWSTRSNRQVPVCLVRLVHEKVITIESDYGSERAPDSDMPIAIEKLVYALDPFSKGAEADLTEYLLAVEKAPADIPFVKQLQAVLPDTVRILVQLYPDGRPGLSTLSLRRHWAALAVMEGTPGYDEAVRQSFEPWVSPVGRVVNNQQRMSTYVRKFGRNEKVRKSINAPLYPEYPISLPCGWRVSVPAIYFYNDFDVVAHYVETGAIRPTPHKRSQNMVQLAMLGEKVGQRNRPDFLRELSKLPQPINAERRHYLLPVGYDPLEWHKRIKESVWGDKFYIIQKNFQFDKK